MSRFHRLIIWPSFLVALCVLFLTGCGDQKKGRSEVENKPIVNVPVFNADSAYAYVQRQVDFGPRIPNTAAHGFTGDYLISQLEGAGGIVKVQAFEETSFDGERLNLRNIMGQFNPAVKKRILLAAHWDTRPFSDKDPQSPTGVADGANDGASGVGVLLEIARIVGTEHPQVGVDFLFFDGEDWGEKEGEENRVRKPEHLESWWAMGAQYWAKNMDGYHAYYGILLDMVGAKGSQFHIEGNSNKYASKIVNKVWNTADQIGYSGYFRHQLQGAINDDHLYVNKTAKIPMIDIIHFDPVVGYFGDYHHTLKDNMDIIDRRTLKAVGQTVLHVLYNE